MKTHMQIPSCRDRLRLVRVGLGVLVVLAFLAVPTFASAVPAHPFKEIFGSAAQPQFESEQEEGMAVDQSTGDVYVIELAGQELLRYKENGEPAPFSALSGSNAINGASGADATPQGEILSTEGSPHEAEVAIAPSSAGATAGDIYVTDAKNGVLDIFASSGAYLGQKSFGYPCGVAVDSTGTVFVGNRDNEAALYKLEPTSPGNIQELAHFPTTKPCQVAAGFGPAAGSVFVADADVRGPVTKLNASTGAEDYKVVSGETIDISSDPATGHVYVTDGLDIKEFDAAGGAPVEVSSTEPPEPPHGVAVNAATGNVYTDRFEVFKIEVFGPLPAGSLLTVEVAGDGGGTVEGGSVAETSTIKCGTGGSECEHSYADELVTLKGVAEGGHTKPVAWEGCNAVNGSNECEVTMSEAKTVKASFVLETNGLTLAHTGEGTLTAECKRGTSFEACASPLSELPYGTEVKVTGTPALGWLVESVAGTGSALGCSSLPCQFTVTQDSTVSVTYAASGAEFADLTVYEGGNGTGTVRSTPSGVDCGSTCTAPFEVGQMVTLKAVATTPGSIFAGWSGNCAPTSATECEVEVKAGGTAVSASFAAVPVISTEPAGANCQYGGIKVEYAGSTYYTCNGLVGANGKTTVIGTATAGECPQGGITIESAGEPASHKAICNGQQGLSGQIGLPGEQGPAGQTGANGQNGLQGPVGPTGATGAPGAAGAPGAQGKQGLAGKVTVTCKVTHAKKITCTVKQPNAKSSSVGIHQDLRWSLHRGGRLIGRGDTSLQYLQHVLNHLPHGHYLLHIDGRQHQTKIAVN